MSEFDSERLDVAFRRVARAARIGRVPSAVLVVANSAGVIRSEGWNATADDVYLLASISKPIIATAIMTLVQDGVLMLHQPLDSYLPEFAASGKLPITTWHLLTHTSGLPEMNWDTVLAYRPSTVVSYERARNHHPDFAPGTRFQYSNLSFYVLAELISRLSGMPWQNYIRQRIFAPLDMGSMALDPDVMPDRMLLIPGGIAGSRAATVQEATDFYISLEMPGAGYWGTANNLVAFGRALLNDSRNRTARLLSPPFLDLMTVDHTSGLTKIDNTRPQMEHYGLGWRKGWINGMRTLPGSARVFEHDGATGGELWIDPEHDLVFVYLTNQFGADASIWQNALQIVYGALR